MLAEELGVSGEELLSWQSQLKVTNVVSLNEFVESGNEPVMDAKGNFRFAQPEEVIAETELKRMLKDAMQLLTEKDLTLKEISRVLEVSESRISQLHTKALQKMKKKMGPYMNILTD